MSSAHRRVSAITAHIAASSFEAVPLAPPDAIFGLNIAYNKDTSHDKLNLGVGAYRTNEGEPYVLNVVKRAEAELLEATQRDGLNKEYLGIAGHPGFVAASQRLVLGDNCRALQEGRVATVQTLSGTGALRIGAELAARFLRGRTVYLSNPTWGNHKAIFNDAGVPWKEYRYFDTATKGLDFAGTCADLQAAPEGSVVLLHVCAHNPTGVDPTREQWARLCELCRSRRLLPFFDCAYQGYATGDLDADAFAVRMFEEAGLEFWVAQSYSKNFGLYGERIGAFSAVQNSSKVADAILSQLKLIVRPMYSNPPKHGALLVEYVLTRPELYQEWTAELKMMSGRINLMRKMLFDELVRIKCPGDWAHVTSQIGMFAYTGLNKAQVQRLVKEFHIYMTANGRISMAGLSTTTVPYFAKCVKVVCSEGVKGATV